MTKSNDFDDYFQTVFVFIFATGLFNLERNSLFLPLCLGTF